MYIALIQYILIKKKFKVFLTLFLLLLRLNLLQFVDLYW